jgi:hypothetical protein
MESNLSGGDHCRRTPSVNQHMKIFFSTLLCFYCATLSGVAQAEIYSCRDASGQIITSDRPMPECANRAITVRRNDGQSLREIPRPLTGDERQKFKLEQEQKKNDELREERRKKDELYLLANYKNEGDIEASRQRALGVLHEKIRIGNEQSKVVNKLLTDLQKELNNGETKSDAQYANLKYRADQLVLSIKNSKTLNEQYEAEEKRINTQYDGILTSYREIVQARKK